MITGRKTRDDIKHALLKERARLQDVDLRIEAANERRLAIDAARAEQLKALARVRVGAVAGDGPPAAESGDDRVSALLERRKAERARLQAELNELDETVRRLEEEREKSADALEAATDELDAAEAAVQSRLEQDEGYRAQRERAAAAERMARFAAEKAAQSEEERAQKGRSYESDPIFMYLWKRGYGTSEYRARGLTRWLDRKVARIVSFDMARANYARLTELPVRLREHAEAVASTAEDEIAELRRLDESARAAAGLDGLDRKRAEADVALDRYTEEVAGAEGARQEAFERLERMDRGEDEAFREMVESLAAQLERDDLQALRHEALATPFPEDDAAVARLLDLEAERERLSETVEDLEEAAQGTRKRVRELQALLREFSEQRYDAPGNSFPDGELVMTMLGQFLAGAATSEVLWRVLEGQRRPPSRRSSPTFGSGGFGRGTPWSGGAWPRSTGRGGGTFGGRPATGRMKGGGFNTGGRVKGGGFRTGGRMARGGFRTGGRKR